MTTFKDGTYVRTTDDMMSWWVERMCERGASDVWANRSSIIARGDKLYHYGTHFMLGMMLRTRTGAPRLFLLNGDGYGGGSGFGPSTSSRQFQLRQLVTTTSVPALTIPFSALDGANIVYESIEPVDIRDDRDEHRTIITNERPGPFATRDSDETEIVEQTRYGYVDENGAPVPGQTWPGDTYRPGATWQAYTVPVEQRVRVEDRTRAHVNTHRVPAHAYADSDARLRDDGRWEFDITRHWLGDALIRAKFRKERYGETTRTRRYFLSSFDYQEARPLYFLCELPKRVRRNGADYPVKPQTVEQAIDDLRPEEIVAAQEAGVNVLRQGDVFAIPTAHTTRELKTLAKANPTTSASLKQAHVLGTNHTVTEAIRIGDDVYARGTMRHEPGDWRAPDHKRLKLGKVWHRLLKNTVPTSVYAGAFNQRGNARAWTSVGTVD